MDEDQARAGRRRWFQFRLAHLLLAVTVLAIALTAIAAPMYRARRGRAIVAALQSEGAEVQFDYQFDADGRWIEDTTPPPLTKLESWLGRDESRHITRIVLCHLPDVSQVVPRVFPQLAALGHPFSLDFRDSSLNGEGLAHVARLRRVEFLDLGGTGLDDENLRSLAAMHQLRELILPATTGDEGFAHLAGLTRLRRLARCRPAFPTRMTGLNEDDFERIREGQWLTDAGLAHLTGLTELEELDLNFAKVTNDGLVRIAGLTNLRSLDLSHTDITDVGLATLRPLHRLENLDLSETSVLGGGLTELAALPKLRSLDLAYCRSAIDLEDVRRRRGEGACQAEGRAALNQAIAHLIDLKQLEAVYLNGVDLYDESCIWLAELPQLRVLDLSKSSITDAGLQYLKEAPRLEELWLARTAVDGDAIKTLKAFRKLKAVHVGGTEIDSRRFEGSRVRAFDDFWEDSPREW